LKINLAEVENAVNVSNNPAKQALARWPQEHQAWAKDFHAALVLGDLSNQQIAMELHRCLAAVADSGMPPDELLGSAWSFGEKRVEKAQSPEQRAIRELPTKDAADLFRGLAVVVGLLLAGFGTYFCFQHGWRGEDWQVWQLGALCIGVSIGAAAPIGWILRLNGKLGYALATWTVVPLAVCGLAGWAVMAAGDDIVPVPNFSGPVLGVLLLVAGFVLPILQTAGRSSAGNGDRWFEQATSLLRGRYGLTRKEANRALESARNHWQQARSDNPELSRPEEEFGPAEAFIISLSAQSAGPILRRWALKQAIFLLMLAFYGITVITRLIQDGPSVYAVLLAGLWVLLTLLVLSGLRPSRRRKAVQETLDQRRRDAEALVVNDADE